MTVKRQKSNYCEAVQQPKQSQIKSKKQVTVSRNKLINGFNAGWSDLFDEL